MGNSEIKYVGFDELNNLKENDLLISILDIRTTCFINHTTLPIQEETIINNIINSYNQSKYTIFIYGRNGKDYSKIQKKIIALNELGFTKFSIYTGGLLEWLLLREVFGECQFGLIGNIGKTGIIEFS